MKEVVDRFVARTRDADALSAYEQIANHARTFGRLAAARRPLDEEVAAVEPLDDRRNRAGVGAFGLDDAVGRFAGDARIACGEQVERRG